MCRVCQGCLLKSLKIDRKHICRPSDEVNRLYFGVSMVWNSNARSKSPSRSSADLEKTEKKCKNHCFLAWVCVHKYVTSARVAFWKASKPVKNMSAGHLIMSIACVLQGLWRGILMWGQNHCHSRRPTSKKPKKCKNHGFWPFSCMYRKNGHFWH